MVSYQKNSELVFHKQGGFQQNGPINAEPYAKVTEWYTFYKGSRRWTWRRGRSSSRSATR